MSKMVDAVKGKREKETKKAVTNFMGGISYELSPIETLKMVTASSIFGEPQYYRDGEFDEARMKDGKFSIDPLFRDYALVLDEHYEGKKTSEIMENIIDKALDADFEATINWAATLRKDYFMRLNPQVIMVRAAMHPKRVEFNEAHPGVFARINAEVMQRADEPASQMAYYLFRNGKKNNLPNNLKRSWAKKLEGLSKYNVHKYKNTGIGMIDVVRVSHAHSAVLDELMKAGNVEVKEDENTWEALRASGMKWKDIYAKTKIGHMALLRNLRGMFTEINDVEFCKRVLEDLKAGVKGGKQFPFRYMSAKQALEKSGADVHHLPMILDALEECMDISRENLPKLKGRTMCLSDNSGSAWGEVVSEYGKTKIAEIDNLSSVITAQNSDDGYVGMFGDRLIQIPISKRNGTMMQTKQINDKGERAVGGATENGIWIFFRDAIDKKEHWDNIFIYSDMQAGHGGLYGTPEGKNEYIARGFMADTRWYGEYVDVAKLINEYRNKVNPKVNVFSVQTAGYENVVVPEYGYRTNIMYGWTGKELVFADKMIRLWDEADEKRATADKVLL